MDCYICLAEPDKNIPLLKCKCYLCPRCYCELKNRKLNFCVICDKKLIRGAKKNK
jgi:hypothetical protein